MLDKLIDLLPHVSCREATKLMSLAMERKLTWKESILVKIHLSVCDACKLFSKQIHGLRHLLKGYRPQNEQQLPAGAKERIKKNLHSS
ncbi:MAG: zf-HC2 domain-containing protein [Candidatus Omnitrophica bacterium]|nr:zf-HC2 domain-containing protein [Candidatus Omnitrophota bacterium]